MLFICVIVWACIFGLDRWVYFTCVILGTCVTWLNLYIPRRHNVFFPMFGCGINMWIQHLPFCQVLLRLMRTVSGSWIGACQKPLRRWVMKTKKSKWLCSTWLINIHCADLSSFCLSCLLSTVADQQCCTQMGHWDSRGNLQHAYVAGRIGCREGEARPCTCKPDGSLDYGVLSLSVSFNIFLLIAYYCLSAKFIFNILICCYQYLF